MDLVYLLLVLQHAGVGGDKLLAVKALAKALAGFLHLFLYLVLYLGYVVLDEHVGAVALLAVAVVDERVVESVHVAAGLPDARVHEDGAVQPHNVLVHLHHGAPPVLLDIVLQLHAQLAVVVHRRQTVIDLRARKHEAILLCVSHYLVEIHLICHIFSCCLVLFFQPIQRNFAAFIVLPLGYFFCFLYCNP